MDIRALNTEDDREVAAAADVVRRGYHSLEGYRAGDDYDDVITAVAERAVETDVIVGVREGRVVACLTYVAEHDQAHSEHDDPGASSFRYFAVDPDERRSGVGAQMVQWVIERARADGKQRIRIHSLAIMHGAMRLYDRFGFVRDPDRDENWDGDIGLAYVLHLG